MLGQCMFSYTYRDYFVNFSISLPRLYSDKDTCTVWKFLASKPDMALVSAKQVFPFSSSWQQPRVLTSLGRCFCGLWPELK